MPWNRPTQTRGGAHPAGGGIIFGIWRLLLAFEVVVFHLLTFPLIGYFAVVSFFVLSGFLMTMIMHSTYGYSWRGRSYFALNRALRLYPSFWLAIIISLLVIAVFGGAAVADYKSAIAVPQTAREWFENLSMLYLDWMPLRVEPRLAPPSWALTTEIFFYTLIGLGISRWRWLTLTWLAASVVYVAYILGFDLGHDWLYRAISSGSLPFAMGASAFHFREHLTQRIDAWRIRPVPLLFGRWILMLGVVLMAGTGLVDYRFTDGVNQINAAISALLVISLYAVRPEGRMQRLDRRLGDFSYPVYLLHWQAGAIASLALFGKPVLGMSVPSLVSFAVALPILFLFSAVCVYGIDVWVNRMRNKVRARVGMAEIAIKPVGAAIP